MAGFHVADHASGLALTLPSPCRMNAVEITSIVVFALVFAHAVLDGTKPMRQQIRPLFRSR